MNPNDNSVKIWNKIAQLYQEKFMNLSIYNQTYDAFCDAIRKSNAAILEIGCGPGNITRYLLAQRPDFQITGIDSSESMIQLAQTNNPDAHFLVLDALEINTLNKQYDAIICGFCLPYITPALCDDFIAKIHSLLPSEGVLYLSFVDDDESKSGFQNNSQGDKLFFNYHTSSNIETRLLKNGFEEPTVFLIEYLKSDQSKEIHTVMLTRKANR